MTARIPILALLLLGGLSAGCGEGDGIEAPGPEIAPSDSGWTALFNGRDLSGWNVKIRGLPAGLDPLGTFEVEDGRLVAGYDNYAGGFDGRFGHLFHTVAWSHYRLHLEYRFTGEQMEGGPDWAWRNSGVMVHAQFPGDMTVDQEFPVSIEVQLLGGGEEGERPTANLCTPGTHVHMDGELVTTHCINSTSPTFRGDEWVKVDVLVLGDSLIVHEVEGEEVLRYTKPVIGGLDSTVARTDAVREGMPLTAGYIALQSESHPVEFRDVRIRDLSGCMDPAASNFRPDAVRSVPEACRYD